MLNTLPEFVIFRILKILFYSNRTSFFNLCQVSQRFINVHRKYFNQIVRVELAARRIQFQYKIYLKNIRLQSIRDDDTINLMPFVSNVNIAGMQVLDFNKIPNSIFNKVENYKMGFAQINNGSLMHIIPILASVLRQIRISAVGDIIGKVIITFGQQTIVDKFINKKEICFYINAPLPCFSFREIHTEHPTSVHGIFCDVDLNIFGTGILFKYCGNFQSLRGVALPYHQYLE